MDNIKMLDELAKAYIDGMPLDTIKDKIKDIVTYYKDNTVTVHIYLNNCYTFIIIYLNLNNTPTFSINGSYIGRAIGEIVNYFKILGFKEIS